MPLPDERKLIRRIVKKQDKRAADELVSFYYREVYAFLYRQTLQKELAMDLTQEVFIGALQSLPVFDETKSGFRTWLYRIAAHKLTDYYRSHSHRTELLCVPEHPKGLEIEAFDFELFERRELAGRALTALAQVEETAQQVVRLKIFAEYTFTEIAAQLELPEGTVKRKYYSTLQFLRKINY